MSALSAGQVELEVQRVSRLVRELLTDVEERMPDGVSDVRVETWALLPIMTGRDEDGDEVEYPIWIFETSRPHVQVGIVRSVLERLLERIRTTV